MAKAKSRRPRKEKLDIDLSVPIDIKNLVLDSKDCFGNMWKPGCSECNICADNDICAILYKDTIGQKVAVITEENGPFADEHDFDNVSWDKFAKLIKDGNEYEFDDIIEIVKKASNCENHETCYHQVVNWATANSFGIEGGIIFDS